MTRKSVLSGKRRRSALHRSCCAPVALALALLALCPAPIFAQSPELRPPTPAGSTNDSSVSASNQAAPEPQVVESTIPPQPGSEAPAEPEATEVAPLPTPPQSVLPPAAPPAPKESADLATALERPGDLNLHGLSLNAALFTIGEQWNINIVAGELQGTVNGVFKQAPLREILDAILLSNGYNYRAVGKSLVISSVEQLGQVNPFFQSATIPVQSADIDEVAQGAQLLTTPKGQVRALKSAHSIVVLDFPDRVKMIRDFVATLENAGSGRFASAENRNGIPLEVGYFRTQHISAKTAEQALAAVISKEGRIGLLEKEDRLLVTDYSDNLAMVEKVLQRIDHPRPQVRITALIYDISLQDIERLGINWSPSFSRNTATNIAGGDHGTSLGVESVTAVPFAPGAAGNTLTFMNLSRHFDITAVAMCLSGASDARLLADPHVLVLENEEAIFQSVSEIPYQQLTQTQQGGEIGTTAFKEAGITLYVKPKIATDGLIRMEVKPEFSRLTGFTPGDNQPIIDVRSASTVLSVANRQTVVIGGLRQRSDIGEFNGVPYLKDMRLIGRLFRSRDTDVRESELVVFIMPEIIPYMEQQNCREQVVSETIRCRLDQIPQAEGCFPYCQRLPSAPNGDPAAMEGESTAPAPVISEPVGEPAASQLSPPTTASESQTQFAPATPDVTSAESPQALQQPPALEPLSAGRIPSAEFQFGVTGRNEQIKALVADGRLRRLPVVTPAITPPAAPAATAGIFAAPAAIVPSLGPADNDQRRTADQSPFAPTLR